MTLPAFGKARSTRAPTNILRQTSISLEIAHMSAQRPVSLSTKGLEQNDAMKGNSTCAGCKRAHHWDIKKSLEFAQRSSYSSNSEGGCETY